jgi:uncharacterized protein (TIGR03000 family)
MTNRTDKGSINMFRRIASMTGLIPLAVLGCLLSARPAAAQNQGYSVWAHRNAGGTGGRSESFFVSPSPAYAPAFTSSAPVARSQAYYYAPGEASPVNDTVTINVTVPADAKIWFDGSTTAQRGKQRQFVSPPLRPGEKYTYDVQVNWKQDGREVTRKRRITIHGGDVVNLTFPETAAAKAR